MERGLIISLNVESYSERPCSNGYVARSETLLIRSHAVLCPQTYIAKNAHTRRIDLRNLQVGPAHAWRMPRADRVVEWIERASRCREARD